MAKGLDRQGQDAVKLSALFSLLCWLLFGLLFESLYLSALLGLLCFFPCFAVLLYYPKAKRKGHAGLVEAELPFCLLAIATELKLGVPFMEALEHASQGQGKCARELAVAVREVRGQGASVQDALRHLSERVESSMLRRAVTQLSAAFEQGGRHGAEPIKRIGAEILSRQRAESKLFSGKMVVSSLLFIAVSAIVPALFQSFSIVGSVVLQMHFTAMQIFLIVVLGFPLLDLAVLFYIRSKTPAFLRC